MPKKARRKTWLLFSALVLLSAATPAFATGGEEGRVQFGLGLYYDYIYALERPIQFRLGLYTPSGFTLEVAGGRGYYFTNARFNTGYTWRLDEAHEYAFLAGLSYVAGTDGDSLSPAAYLSYRSCRFGLGPFDEFIDVPFLWYGLYIGYIFHDLSPANGFDQYSGLNLGTMLEYRF